MCACYFGRSAVSSLQFKSRPITGLQIRSWLFRVPRPHSFRTFPPQPYPQSATFYQLKQESSVWIFTFIASVILGGAIVQAVNSGARQPLREKEGQFSRVVDISMMATDDIPPGRLGNLTEEQEAKLVEFWGMLLKIFGAKAEGDQASGDSMSENTGTQLRVENSTQEKRKSKLNFLGLRNGDTSDKKNESISAKSTATNVANLQVAEADDKYGQTKEFQKALADQSPEEIRDTFWTTIKHDHPDVLLLRFLRARKWDVNRAVVMLISTLHWRAVEMHIDDDIMKGGEALAMEQSKSSDPTTQKAGEDFMSQLRMGKSFVYGVDKIGRPMCHIRVRLHKIGAHGEKSVERFTTHIIETTRVMLTPPFETGVIIFDMTNFSLANMDYPPVKFMIKCFEANYPEYLGVILIHKAPWVFSGIWRVVRGWLDPVVAAKVHFTNSVEDLEEFIPRNRILKELGGEDDYEYQYIEPNANENEAMQDIQNRDAALARRQELSKELQSITHSWVITALKGDKEHIEIVRRKREDFIEQYRRSYWDIDPYVRARSFYDRCGMLRPGKKVDFYPDSKPQTNGATQPIQENDMPPIDNNEKSD